MTNTIFDKLAEDLKIVSSARFNKVKRLKNETWWSLLSISSISIALIIVTICENTHQIKIINPILFFDIQIQTWIFTIISSIITLAISIAISASKIDIEQEKLISSALSINKLAGLTNAAGAKQINESYESLYRKYQEELSKNVVNHDDVDHRIAKCRVKKCKGPLYCIDIFIIQYKAIVPFIIILYCALSVVISILSQILVGSSC